MKRIPLTQGKFLLVDDEDYERVMAAGPWSLGESNNKVYYARKHIYREKNGERRRTTIGVHRFILGVTDPNIDVDHKNHNGLDNRKSNLRPTGNKNPANSRKHKSRRGIRNLSSKFKGVCWSARHQKWRAYCTRIHLGHFVKEKEAAKAYDEKAIELFGEFAYLNFPNKKGKAA